MVFFVVVVIVHRSHVPVAADQHSDRVRDLPALPDVAYRTRAGKF